MIKVLYLDVFVEKFRFVIIVFSLTHRLCVYIFHNAISNIFLGQKGLFSDRLLGRTNKKSAFICGSLLY